MTDVRIEFLEHCEVDLDTPNAKLLAKNEQAFETWLKNTDTLVAGKWLPRDQVFNFPLIEIVKPKVFTEYECCIMWNTGKMLWKDHGEAYENHFDYFMYQIVKPYNMQVKEFDHNMKMYAEKLKLMQPPSYKKCQSYADADWKIQEKQVDKSVRRAIFNGLPKPYQKHLRTS